MNQQLKARITQYVNECDAGATQEELAAAFTWADTMGYSTDDEALELAVSHLIYDDEALYGWVWVVV